MKRMTGLIPAVIFAGALALAVLGCTSVLSTHPVGEQALKVKAEDWDGTWAGVVAVTIAVVDGEKGRLRVTFDEVRFGKNIAPEMPSFEAHLRSSGDWLFVSARPLKEEGDEETPYAWYRINREDGQLLLWPPRLENFRGLVKEGVLPGKVLPRKRGRGVILGKLEPEHLAVIKEERGVLFSKGPFVLRRIYFKAGEWHNKAAEQGDAEAQLHLGRMYFNGMGVPEDHVQAYKWLVLASAGTPDAKDLDRVKRKMTKRLRKQLRRNMTEAQRAEGERLASEWLEKFHAKQDGD